MISPGGEEGWGDVKTLIINIGFYLKPTYLRVFVKRAQKIAHEKMFRLFSDKMSII